MLANECLRLTTSSAACWLPHPLFLLIFRNIFIAIYSYNIFHFCGFLLNIEVGFFSLEDELIAFLDSQ